MKKRAEHPRVNEHRKAAKQDGERLPRFRPEQLHVVTVYSNPVRWKTRRRAHMEFEEHMLDSGVALTTVEVALGRRPFNLPDSRHINRVRLRQDGMIWNKEAALNVGINRIAESAKYIGWFDADIEFRREDWARESVHALQQYAVIQPWSHAYDLGPRGEHMNVHVSFCHQFWHGLPVGPNHKPYNFAHPGYAWCATRQALHGLGGLLDVGVLGSGDHHMAMSLVGQAEVSLPKGLSPAYRRIVLEWQKRAEEVVKRNLGFVEGTIEHAWHGKKADRKYVSRWKLLVDHKFDPDRDIRRNAWGLWELNPGKPDFMRDVDRYFKQRFEDSNYNG